jgi:hypothetical protein
MSSVPADDVQLIDASFDKRIDDLIDIEASPGASEDGSALKLQISYKFLVEFEPVVRPGVQPHVAELYAPDFRAAVEIDQG